MSTPFANSLNSFGYIFSQHYSERVWCNGSRSYQNYLISCIISCQWNRMNCTFIYLLYMSLTVLYVLIKVYITGTEYPLFNAPIMMFLVGKIQISLKNSRNTLRCNFFLKIQMKLLMSDVSTNTQFVKLKFKNCSKIHFMKL